MRISIRQKSEQGVALLSILVSDHISKSILFI